MSIAGPAHSAERSMATLRRLSTLQGKPGGPQLGARPFGPGPRPTRLEHLEGGAKMDS